MTEIQRHYKKTEKPKYTAQLKHNEQTVQQQPINHLKTNTRSQISIPRLKSRKLQPHQSRHNKHVAALLGKYETSTTSDPPQLESPQPRQKSTMLQPHQSRHNEETPHFV